MTMHVVTSFASEAALCLAAFAVESAQWCNAPQKGMQKQKKT
jgi:hypothetical protein